MLLIEIKTLIHEFDLFAKFIDGNCSSCVFKSNIDINILKQKGLTVRQEGYQIIRIGYFGDDTIFCD